MIKVELEGKEALIIIDIGYLGIINLQRFVDRLKLTADAEIDFTLNTADGTVEKQISVFEKLRIKVGKSEVSLPVIVVGGSHFDLLLGVNWIK